MMFTGKWKYLPAVSIVFALAAATVPWMLRAPAPVVGPVTITITHQKEPSAAVILRRHGAAPVRLMSYIVEERSEQSWRRLSGETFTNNTTLANHRDYTFTVRPPAGTGGWRLRVKYGLGTHGIELWRARARVAWRTGRIRDALFRFEEWEACESISEVVR